MAMNEGKRQALMNEIEFHKKKDSVESDKAHIERKHIYGNLTRYMNVQQQELRDEQEVHRQKAEAAFKERQHDQQNNLARELDNIKRNEIREMKLRQQLRENSHELRDLERKLKAAYINKELAAQISQKEAEKLNKKLQERMQQDILTSARLEEAAFRKRELENELVKKTQYRKELQDQIILQEKSKRYLYEDFLREKKMIDDIVQRIHDEDQRDFEMKMCKMRKTQREIVAFKQAQDMWKKRKREEMEEENRKIQEYLLAQGAVLKARKKEKESKDAEKARLQENMAKQIYSQKLKEKEKEDIIQELLIEEQKEAIERKHKEDVEKEIRKRVETRESLTAQMIERQEKLKQDAAADAKYKDELLAKLAEDEKLEQMSDQKRRMKMLQLRKDIEQMMIDKRQRKAEEMQLQIKLKEQEEEEMEQRRLIIEEERLRMLKEHVKNLIGYLPKGLLRPDDLPHLETDIAE